MRSRRSGISAVVGTAIALMIFFTVVIPMWIYMQNVQTLFMDEVSRRLRFEVEKVNEVVEVSASLQPPELHPFGRSRLFMTLRNKSPVEVVVPAIYVESSKIGLQKIDKQYKLAPGEVIREPVADFILEPDEVVVVRIPTLRGNSFASNLIGPNNLPYMLVVQLSNASFGYWYRIRVATVLGDINRVVGCVSARSDLFATGCRLEAFTWKFVSSPDDLNIIAAFNVAPGVYEVSAVRCTSFGSGCADIPPGAVPVEVDSSKVVELGAASRVVIQRPLPLRVTPLLQNYTFVASNNTDVVMVSVPFLVTLGNNTEPLFNVDVRVEVLNADNLTATLSIPGSGRIMIKRLSPGETYFGVVVFQVNDERRRGSLGGYFIYRISLAGATGQVSRENYSPSDFEFAEAVGAVVFCRAGFVGGESRVYCLVP
jgi:hypothetical protein